MATLYKIADQFTPQTNTPQTNSVIVGGKGLYWSKANAKLKLLLKNEGLRPFWSGHATSATIGRKKKKKVYSLDLISGWSCPFAKDCLSKVHIIDGKKKIVDGPDVQFRCFSASQEVFYNDLYDNRKRNFDLLKQKSQNEIFNQLSNSLPDDACIVRLHVGGDIFSENYFLAWCELAESNPNILFYTYTKSLNFWVKNLDKIPANFVLTASRGGRLDHLIEEHNLRSVKVILSESDANGLPIDHDDSHAADPQKRGQDFALLIHGIQPKGSIAGKAVKALKGIGSYTRKKKK